MRKRIFSVVMAFCTGVAAVSFVMGLVGTLRNHLPSRTDICFAFGIATLVAAVAALHYIAKALGIEEP